MKKVYCDFCKREIHPHPEKDRTMGKIIFSGICLIGEGSDTISFDACKDCFESIRWLVNVTTMIKGTTDREKRMALRKYARILNFDMHIVVRPFTIETEELVKKYSQSNNWRTNEELAQMLNCSIEDVDGLRLELGLNKLGKT
jgi:hypothetical protein